MLCDTLLTEITDGCVIVTCVDAVQVCSALPPGAVAVNVYTPAGKPVDDTTAFAALVITTVDPALLVTAIDPSDNP